VAKLGALAALESLDLSGTQVSSKGIEQLEKLAKLKKLVLWKARRIDDSAVTQLNAMRRLDYLDVGETGISANAKKQLMAAHVR
jgi:hypothetical protein